MIITKYITKPCPNCNHSMKVINGLWLRSLRENANLSQRKFGKGIISGPYISDIENNRRNCPNDVLVEYLKLRK